MVLINLFAGQQWRCRHREQICEHGQGRREEDKRRQQHGNTHTPAYGKQPVGLCCDTGSSARCSVTAYRGGMGTGERCEEEGTYVYLWLTLTGVWQKPAQYCKAIIFQYNFFKDNKLN